MSNPCHIPELQLVIKGNLRYVCGAEKYLLGADENELPRSRRPLRVEFLDRELPHREILRHRGGTAAAISVTDLRRILNDNEWGDDKGDVFLGTGARLNVLYVDIGGVRPVTVQWLDDGHMIYVGDLDEDPLPQGSLVVTGEPEWSRRDFLALRPIAFGIAAGYRSV